MSGRPFPSAAAAIFAGHAAVATEANAPLAPKWEYVADGVMGGVSEGRLFLEMAEGREIARLTGRVSLDNDGGFIQMASDLAPSGGVVDASGWTGLAFEAKGDGESYELRLRTDQLTRPWQSFRASFATKDEWTTIRLPFAAFTPRKTDAALDPSRLRRIGVLAIGRAFDADVSVAAIRFYR